jgi:hypothetical protein
MMRLFWALLGAAMALWAQPAGAQPALSPPQIGYIQDGGNSLRPVYGIAGNFVLGDATASGVISAAFSGSFGLVKTDSAVYAIDRQGQVLAGVDAPAGSALFAFSRSGAPAFAYFVDANVWMTWDGQTFQPLSIDLTAFGPAAVLSVGSPNDGEAAIVLQRDDGLWDLRVLLATSEVTSQTAILGVSAPLLLLASGDLIYSDANGIVIRTSDGQEKHIAAPLPESFVLQQMGDAWVELRGLNTPVQRAVRINGSQSYALPGVDQ